jgi:hypothetical protein
MRLQGLSSGCALAAQALSAAVAVGELALRQPSSAASAKQPSSGSSAPSAAAAASSSSPAGSSAAAEAADAQRPAASNADVAGAQEAAAANQSPTDQQVQQPPRVPLERLVHCCMAQGAHALRSLEGHGGAKAAGRRGRTGGRAAAAAASRLLATAVAGLAGLLTASASASAAAAAWQRPFPTGNAAAQVAACAGVSDMQVLLRQCAELAKDAWTMAEQMPELAADLIEVMGRRSAAASDAQNATELLSCYPWRCLQLSACLCFPLKGLVWHSWFGFHCHKQLKRPARLLQSGCTIMADVAMAGGSDSGTHAAAWQGSRGKLQRMLGPADHSRLEPLFQQVVIGNFESTLMGGSQHVCVTCQVFVGYLLTWPASHSTQPATEHQSTSAIVTH